MATDVQIFSRSRNESAGIVAGLTSRARSFQPFKAMISFMDSSLNLGFDNENPSNEFVARQP